MKEPSLKYTLVTSFLGSDNMQLFQSSFSGKKVDGIAQVLDCLVTLQGGMIVPIKFLKKTPSSVMKRVTSFFGAAGHQLELSDNELVTLQAGEPIKEIYSNGSTLMAKGLSKLHLWKYVENSGRFIGPSSFNMEAIHPALMDDAVVGFDVGLLKKEFYGVLHKRSITFDENTFVLGEEQMDRAIRLPKNRVKATIIAAMKCTFILADKKEGKEHYSHIFWEHDGKLQKVSGFSEGSIVEIAGNSSCLFARSVDGEVFYQQADGEWKEFKTSNGGDD